MSDFGSIKILFVEDLEEDVIIAEETLKREGIVIETRRVTGLEEVRPVLEEFRPDVVVSDYNLPGFTAIDVLRICRGFDPHLPFVVFTGSINEDVAVICLKEGATDYVLKDHIKRLPISIKEALKKRDLEKEKASALRALQLAEERYRYICHTISDYAYAFIVEEDGTMRGEWISDSFYRVFGLTLPEINGKGGWQSVVYPEDLPRALEHAQKVLSGKADVAEFRFVTKDGRPRWLRDYAVPVFDPDTGRVVRVYGASQDITERKETEEKLKELAERFEHLLSSSPTITYSLKVTDRALVPAWVSSNIKDITGYDEKEVLEPDWWVSNLHPEDREEAIKKSSMILERGSISHEYRFRKK
ncbi:MAG: PAS domain S-box protein, partial [Nitrospirae bacterium]